MRSIKEILRLRYELKLSHRKISASTTIALSSIMDIIRRAESLGITWPLPEEMDDVRLEEQLYPRTKTSQQKTAPDMEWIHRELKRKSVTLQLLWLEYKENHPDGIQYSQFCQRYRDWSGKLDVVMRQNHRAGEKMFVDYAGQTVPITDSVTGEVSQAQIFISVLGASGYAFAKAYPSQELPYWIDAHCCAFEFYDGVTEIVVPDNLKAGVTHACRYEPDINPTYQEMALHYGVAVIPARPRKPRDKPKAEVTVQIVERWILAALRDHTFFSIFELNQAIEAELVKLNNRPFQKMEGCRRSLYETIDRPALKPLPASPYEFAEWKKVRVNIDYHVDIDHSYYSAPHQLIHQELDARVTTRMVEIFNKGHRVATHIRSFKPGKFVTEPAHRPASHQKYLEWTPSRIVQWANSVGPNTETLINKIIKSKIHPEQGYRSCLGVLRLGKRYSNERLEAAATRALTIDAVSYRSIKSILEKGLDQVPVQPMVSTVISKHENLRGPVYYGKETTSC
jgi:transposase